jgi:hypothetical protein
MFAGMTFAATMRKAAEKSYATDGKVEVIPGTGITNADIMTNSKNS